MNTRRNSWKSYAFEFFSIFIAVISAFALSNWNDNRKDSQAELKILTEIRNGLEKDKQDFTENTVGHKTGIKSCKFWRKILRQEAANLDSLQPYYFILTRDFITIQNSSGYETLKSKGFEVIDNDSLRSEIISLYEFDYQLIQKMEEEYHEGQFQENYFKSLNDAFAPNFEYDAKGNICNIELPLKVPESEKKVLLSYLLKIQSNRKYLFSAYEDIIVKIDKLQEAIEVELKQ
ncbi:MAG: hypothetical protein AAF740_14090 [Bacteroidota bacterium]